MSEKNIHIIHNIPAPYRLPLFEALSEEYDLTVSFMKPSQPGRKWDPEVDAYEFNEQWLRYLTLGPLTLNYSLVLTLLRRNDDIYIVGDTAEGILTTLIVFLVAKIKGKRFVLWSGLIETDYDQETSQRGWEEVASSLFEAFVSACRSVLYSRADGVVAYSKKTQAYAEKKGADPRIITIGGQVTPAELLAEPQDEIEKDDEYVILFVGYLYDRKGVDVLVDAFLRLDISDIRLLIAGTGPEMDELQSMAAGEANIEFVGYIEDEQKAAYYSSADVVVLPTRHDPAAHVVNEALYYGTPVITTEADGSSTKVDDAGKVVEPDDSEELATAIETILCNDELRQNCAERARELGRRYTNPSVGIEPFIELIERL